MTFHNRAKIPFLHGLRKLGLSGYSVSFKQIKLNYFYNVRLWLRQQEKIMPKLLLFLFITPSFCFAQIGGRGIYKFLNTAPNARSAAYGGTSMVTWAND